MSYWAEIVSGTMDFNQIDRDTAILKSLTLKEALELWKRFVLPNGEQVSIFNFV